MNDNDYVDMTFSAAEWKELDDHAEELGRQIAALEPLAEAAVAYRQVLYGLVQRGALDANALDELERADQQHGDALDDYINDDEGDTDD